MLIWRALQEKISADFNLPAAPAFDQAEAITAITNKAEIASILTFVGSLPYYDPKRPFSVEISAYHGKRLTTYPTLVHPLSYKGGKYKVDTNYGMFDLLDTSSNPHSGGMNIDSVQIRGDFPRQDYLAFREARRKERDAAPTQSR